jgi:hypothetical protein
MQDAIGALHDIHVLVTWLEGQSERSTSAAFVGAALEEQAFFEDQGRRLHAELLDRRPREVLGRALESMGKARSAA